MIDSTPRNPTRYYFAKGILEFGDHKRGCEEITLKPRPDGSTGYGECTCGFSDVLRLARKEKP